MCFHKICIFEKKLSNTQSILQNFVGIFSTNDVIKDLCIFLNCKEEVRVMIPVVHFYPSLIFLGKAIEIFLEWNSQSDSTWVCSTGLQW